VGLGRDEVWATDKGRALWGFAPDTLLDRAALIERVHPEDRVARDRRSGARLRLRVNTALSIRVVLPDGTLRWIGARGHCMNVGDNKGIRLLGISMDVTAQKQAQDALRESEARFRTMANTAPVMIWMSGLDKLCTFFNKGLARLYWPPVGAGAWRWMGRGRYNHEGLRPPVLKLC